ncbi:protein C8orf37 homolog isoform X1 [Scyliorhinus canicula]|uniref:protein C8orf37 homolog isoform X1 n=1 Tax=Scyliorhinus canicula TaxID=7830 RepID=UPI0018F42F4B|nr:protein C8orf37 homolog isoform X1 [Scyliorhinus canicula]
MADDLDELLDEVELRFCRDRSAGAGGLDKEVKISAPSVRCKEAYKEEDDLSDLIEDIFHDDPSVSELSKSSPGTITNCSGHRAPSQTKGRKCCPVYLGGSSAPLGLGTNTSQRTCDQLRCTTCDFRVITLDDYEWNKSCDYLFFRCHLNCESSNSLSNPLVKCTELQTVARNNMPDLDKLKVKTLSRIGTRAYACQCSWRSIQNLADLREEQELRWVCGRH